MKVRELFTAVVLLLTGCLLSSCTGEEKAAPQDAVRKPKSQAQPVRSRGPRYNEAAQFGSRNSYWRNQSDRDDPLSSGPSQLILDQMLYNRIRFIELDLHPGKESKSNPFRVLHSKYVGNTECYDLQHCLKIVKTFHDHNPKHNVVTIALECKHSGQEGEPLFDDFNTVDELDRILEQGLGSDRIFKPMDLINLCPEVSNIHRGVPFPVQAAAEKCGWPTMDELRGKFIITMHANAQRGANRSVGTYMHFRHYTQRAVFPVRTKNVDFYNAYYDPRTKKEFRDRVQDPAGAVFLRSSGQLETGDQPDAKNSVSVATSGRCPSDADYDPVTMMGRQTVESPDGKEWCARTTVPSVEELERWVEANRIVLSDPLSDHKDHECARSMVSSNHCPDLALFLGTQLWQQSDEEFKDIYPQDHPKNCTGLRLDVDPTLGHTCSERGLMEIQQGIDLTVQGGELGAKRSSRDSFHFFHIKQPRGSEKFTLESGITGSSFSENTPWDDQDYFLDVFNNFKHWTPLLFWGRYQGCLMVRASLEPNAPYFAICRRPHFLKVGRGYGGGPGYSVPPIVQARSEDLTVPPYTLTLGIQADCDWKCGDEFCTVDCPAGDDNCVGCDNGVKEFKDYTDAKVDETHYSSPVFFRLQGRQREPGTEVNCDFGPKNGNYIYSAHVSYDGADWKVFKTGCFMEKLGLIGIAGFSNGKKPKHESDFLFSNLRFSDERLSSSSLKGAVVGEGNARAAIHERTRLSADKGKCSERTEKCDGIDNDCDGRVDEGFWGDVDRDGQLDCTDPDDDNDCIPDSHDHCPVTPGCGSFTAAVELLPEGIEPACADPCQAYASDQRIGMSAVLGPTELEKCREKTRGDPRYEPCRKDIDEDGVADVCDRDDDNDCVPDAVDLCPSTANCDPPVRLCEKCMWEVSDLIENTLAILQILGSSCDGPIDRKCFADGCPVGSDAVLGALSSIPAALQSEVGVSAPRPGEIRIGLEVPGDPPRPGQQATQPGRAPANDCGLIHKRAAETATILAKKQKECLSTLAAEAQKCNPDSDKDGIGDACD